MEQGQLTYWTGVFYVTNPDGPPICARETEGMQSEHSWSDSRCKDLKYDGTSNWKSFLYKFKRLSCSQQWSEVEQHDQICFSLEGAVSDYHTQTNRDISLRDILCKFGWRFKLSESVLMHRLNIQSAMQRSRESLHQFLPLPLIPFQVC